MISAQTVEALWNSAVFDGYYGLQSGFVTAIHRQSPVLEAYFRLMDEPDGVVEKLGAPPLPQVKGDIRYDDVSYRFPGTVEHDEARLMVVTMRSEGFIEQLFVGKTGQHVHAGEPLFRVYSPDIQRAQIDLIVATRSLQRGVLGAEADRQLEGAMQRLRKDGLVELHTFSRPDSSPLRSE